MAKARFAGAIALACVALATCGSEPTEHHGARSHAPSAAPPPLDPQHLAWPDLPPEEPEPLVPARALRLALDAGHGAKDNPGATSSYCVSEQDYTLALAYDVAAVLEELGGFAVTLPRAGSALVPYADRVAAAERAGADAFVSLHFDIRGTPDTWTPDGDKVCKRSYAAPGFSVLWSDEGDAALVAERHGLARSVAAELEAVGFLPYAGEEYRGLYEGDAAPGVFVDRHEPQKRIFVLRRTRMPAVIVETYNALDPREAEQWESPAVRRAFALALGRALVTALSPANP